MALYGEFLLVRLVLPQPIANCLTCTKLSLSFLNNFMVSLDRPICLFAETDSDKNGSHQNHTVQREPDETYGVISHEFTVKHCDVTQLTGTVGFVLLLWPMTPVHSRIMKMIPTSVNKLAMTNSTIPATSLHTHATCRCVTLAIDIT